MALNPSMLIESGIELPEPKPFFYLSPATLVFQSSKKLQIRNTKILIFLFFQHTIHFFLNLSVNVDFAVEKVELLINNKNPVQITKL